MKLSQSLALSASLVACLAQVRAADGASFPGLTEPFLDVTLSASVPGLITARPFKEGDAVKPGDVLIELDHRLEELESDRRKVVRDQKRGEFESTRKLFSATKGVSQEDVEKKEAEFRVAAVEFDMAQEQLRRRRVLSPLAGIITEITVEQGEACQPYQALVRVVDTRRCYFVVNVEAKVAAGLQSGQDVKLEIQAGAGPSVVRGRIAFLSPVVDAASGLQKVKVLFENGDAKVAPGVAGRLILE